MHRLSELFWCFQLPLDECIVNHDFGSDIGQFTFLPRLDLPAHWLEVALHSIDTH